MRYIGWVVFKSLFVKGGGEELEGLGFPFEGTSRLLNLLNRRL